MSIQDSNNTYLSNTLVTRVLLELLDTLMSEKKYTINYNH